MSQKDCMNVRTFTETELQKWLSENYPLENQSCEWKEFKSLKQSVTGDAGKDIASYASAFANGEGGTLVMGISDHDHAIVGIQDLQSYTTENLPLRLLGKCVNLNSEGLELEEIITSDTQKRVWILQIPKHSPRSPVIAHDKTWQRIGDSIVVMRPERMTAILSEPMNTDQDWSAAIVDDATLADLDQEALAVALAQFKRRSSGARFEAEIDSWSWETLLDKAKITINGKITRTALLLLGKSESSHFLSPHPVELTWKLNDSNERSHQHFSIPFLLTSSHLLTKIRNYKTKLYPSDQLLPIEVDKYETRVILEALHNCIAHQDYSQNSRVIVTETSEELRFENSGAFFLGRFEDYIDGDKTPDRYRNKFLANAMYQFGMIDSMGYGIHSMMKGQRKRYLPLPDYSLSTPEKVILVIRGQAIDPNFALLLYYNENLTLSEVFALDRVQRGAVIDETFAKSLKKRNLIEGRKPNYHLSAHLAKATGTIADYVRNKAFDDQYYKDLIIQFIRKSGKATRAEIEALLLDKLSELLDIEQKNAKIKNLLYSLHSREQVIERQGSRKNGYWILNPSKVDEIKK